MYTFQTFLEMKRLEPVIVEIANLVVALGIPAERFDEELKTAATVLCEAGPVPSPSVPPPSGGPQYSGAPGFSHDVSTTARGLWSGLGRLGSGIWNSMKDMWQGDLNIQYEKTIASLQRFIQSVSQVQGFETVGQQLNKILALLQGQKDQVAQMQKHRENQTKAAAMHQNVPPPSGALAPHGTSGLTSSPGHPAPATP